MIKANTIINRILPACLLLIILAACNKYEISEEQADAFIKFFGSYSEDIGSKIKLDDDGGYVMVGTWTDTEAGMGKQMCLLKTDKYGNEVDWSPALFGGSKDDFGNDFLITDDGYVMVGTSTGANDSLDILLVKTDKQGIAQPGFPKTIDVGSNEEGFAIEESDEFGYILLGYADNHPQSVGYNDPLKDAHRDMLFVLTQGNGDIVITRVYGGDGEEEGRCIAKTASGLVLLGSSTSWSEGNTDIFLVKTDFEGVRRGGYINAGTINNDVGECLKIKPDGTIILSGTSTNATGGQPRIYLAEVSDDLNVNRISVSITGNFTGKSIDITPEGNYIMVGTITLTDNNIYVMGLDANGEEMFYTTFGRTGEQSASSFSITPDGGMIILGSNSFEGNSMISLIKTGPEGSMD